MYKERIKIGLEYAGARMREPSTYLGLAGMLLAFHVADAASWASVITSLGLGIGGAIGILLPENSK